MSVLFELLADFFLDVFGPESPRGLVVLALLGGLALCGVNGWLLSAYPQPLHEPAWGFVAIMCGIVFGSMWALLGGLHLARDRDDVLLASAALLTNGAAIVLAVMAAAAGR